MFADEPSEPIAKRASFFGDLVQFGRSCLLAQGVEHVRWNKLGLSEPRNKALPAVEPVDRRVDWRCDGIQEIEAERVGDENRRRSLLHDWPP